MKAAAALVVGIFTSPLETAATIIRQLVWHPELLVYLAIGFIAALLMMLFVDRRMDVVFSGFWYSKQTELRDNLKQARQDVKRIQAG